MSGSDFRYFQDAELAIEHNMDGIVVSNHGESVKLQHTASDIDHCRPKGGRQIDGALPALYALRQICTSPTIKAAQESGKLTVFYDSGIRTGSDIYKALALGAQGVLRTSIRPFNQKKSLIFPTCSGSTLHVWIGTRG